jgi:hypothetical protein
MPVVAPAEKHLPRLPCMLFVSPKEDEYVACNEYSEAALAVSQVSPPCPLAPNAGLAAGGGMLPLKWYGDALKPGLGCLGY